MTAYLIGALTVGRLMLAALLPVNGSLVPAWLQPATLAGWNAYVEATEWRRTQELGRPDRYLALDFLPDARQELVELQGGRVLSAPVRTVRPDGVPLEIPGAMVHHWRGALFIPGVTVAAVLSSLQQGPPAQKDVLRSRVLARGPDWMKVYLRLQRSKIVTVVYDTEHDVRFAEYGPMRAASATVLTGVAEVAAPDSVDERRLGPEQGRGFLWRLNAYWRYMAVPGGVIAECESITLSRTVPFGLGMLARPLIDSTARESMESALRAVRDGVKATPSPLSSSQAR